MSGDGYFKKCPDCGEAIAVAARTHAACGWWAARDDGTPNARPTTSTKFEKHQICDGKGCGFTGLVGDRSKPQYIVGRSIAGKHVCNICFGRFEDKADYRLLKIGAFKRAHVDDYWGVLMRLADNVGNDYDRAVEFMAEFKAHAKHGGGMLKTLPYDPTRRVDS